MSTTDYQQCQLQHTTHVDLRNYSLSDMQKHFENTAAKGAVASTAAALSFLRDLRIDRDALTTRK